MKFMLMNVTVEWDDKKQQFQGDVTWHDGGEHTRCWGDSASEAAQKACSAFIQRNCNALEKAGQRLLETSRAEAL